MNSNRVIGIELVVDDQGTVKLIKFADSAKKAFGQAERSAEGLDASMAKGARRAQQTEGAMAEVERRAGTLSSKVKLIGAGFESLYRTGKSAFDRLHQAGRGAFNRLHQAGSIFWGTTRRITGAVFSLQGALVGLGLGLVAKSFLDVSRETENYHTRLSTLLGSQQKATAAMQYFQEVASGVPFTLQAVVEAGTSLEAFGANSKEWLAPLTDLAAVMGIDLPEAAQALGRAYAGGAGAADIFRERGILQIMKDAAKMKAGIEDITKLTLPQFRQLMLLTFTDPDGKIAGASKGLAKNWDGMLSMLSDKWFQFRQKMMASGVFDLLKNQLQRLLDALDTHKDTITKWAESAGKAVEGLLQRAVNFIDSIINNWGVWEARWEKFKSGASEVWTQTKNVASVVGSLLKIALDGWNNLPPVVREFGLVGALIGGVKGKIIFAAIVGLSALLDKAKELSKGEPDLQIGGVTMPGSPERGYLFKFRQWLEELKGQKPTQSLRELNAGYYRKDYYPTGPMGGDMGGATAQGLADLGIPEPELPAATSSAGTTPKSTTSKFDLSVGMDEKELAKREAAGLKAVKEYMAAVEEASKLEVSLRQETMTSYERSFDDLERGYIATYDKIEDLEYKGAITSEQALDMRRQASSNYLTARDKMEADHNRGLLRKIEEFGKSGRELQKVQLAHEIEDLQKAGYDKELIRQYTAQRMYEIDKSMLEKTLEAWTNTDQLVADGTKVLMDGLQQEWTGFFTKVFDNGLSNIEDSFGDFCDAIFSMWKQMLAQFVAQWTLSGFASIMLGLINLLKGGEFTFNLNGGGGSGVGVGTVLNLASTAKSVWNVGSTVVGALGVGGRVDALLGAMGLGASSFAGTTGALMAAGPAATAAAEAALAAEVAAALEGLEIGASLDLGFAAAEMGGAAAGGADVASSAALAAGMAGPGLAMAMALGPGMIGMLFGDQINSLFGWDGGLTPEEAISNWEGQSAFIENIAKSLDGLAPTLSGINQEFGMFSQAAQDAALDFERLETVAGLTKEQLDAVKASLSPTAQAFLDSGIKARNLNNEVSRLTQEMHAAINSYTMTSDAVNMYNDRIDKLAADMGLTGEAARRFKDEIWSLANSFSQGGEEAGRFDKALSDFVGQTLGSIAEGANSASEAVGGLIGTMQNASVVGNTFSSSLPRGDISAPASAYSSVGVYHQGGLVRHSGGGIGNWGWVGYEELMRLAGDEVLTKLRLGEYVVQAGAVNNMTVPWLEAVNDTGQPPVLTAPVPMPVPVATSTQTGSGDRRVIFEAGAVNIVIDGYDKDPHELALEMRDILAELDSETFKGA